MQNTNSRQGSCKESELISVETLFSFLNNQRHNKFILKHRKLFQYLLSRLMRPTIALQASLSMGFSRQDYWSGLPCPPPGDLLHPGMAPTPLTPPALAAYSLPLCHLGCQFYPCRHMYQNFFLWFKYAYTHTPRNTHHILFICSSGDRSLSYLNLWLL